jgi:hypothetical protein
MLAQDANEAFRQKQFQMLNNALLAEAKEAQDEVASAVKRLDKIARAKTRKSVDQDYLEQAQSLLEAVDMKPRSQAGIERQKKWEDWSAAREADGHDLVVPPGFAATLNKTHWSRLSANLPTTRYDDILIQPRTKDLVLGTHGRSIWILDDASQIADWTPQIAAKAMHLFAPPRATVMWYWDDISNMAQGFYAAENPADGATFSYWLNKPAQKVRLIVRGADNKVIREVEGKTARGVINPRIRHR